MDDTEPIVEDEPAMRRLLRDPDFGAKHNVYQNGVMFYGPVDVNGRSQNDAKTGKPIHSIEAALYWREHRPAAIIQANGTGQGGGLPNKAKASEDQKPATNQPSVVTTAHGVPIAIPRLIRREGAPPNFGKLTKAGTKPASVDDVDANGSYPSTPSKSTVIRREHNLVKGSCASTADSVSASAEADFNALHPKLRGAILYDILEDDELHHRAPGKAKDRSVRYTTACRLLRISEECCAEAMKAAKAAKDDGTPIPKAGETARGLAFLQAVTAPLSLLNLYAEIWDIDLAKYADVNDGLYDDLLADDWESWL